MTTNLLLPKVSIAPMMDWTDRHYRFFMRIITKKTLLYTEMITTGAILYGDRDRFLLYSKVELPLVIQLGGDNPDHLAECSLIAEGYGYTEVNLNVGCPSDRVQNGNFGACLMAKPELVASCVAKMKSRVKIPVTVKHRIGIDSFDKYEDLRDFVKIVSEAGCDKFIVHARIAILKGLSPSENRTIPPLRYNDVFELKKEFPHLNIEINGGIKDPLISSELFEKTDGIMIGRKAYEDPYIFSEVDSRLFKCSTEIPTRKEVLYQMIPYIEEHAKRGGKPNQIIRHILGLFNGVRGAKYFRRYLSENMYTMTDIKSLIQGSVEKIED